MSSIYFDESNFINEFMTEYDASNQDNYTIIFDEFLNVFLERMSVIELENILKLYYSENDIDKFKIIWGDDIKLIALMQLYSKLYKVIEKSFEEKYYSDADTDIEN